MAFLDNSGNIILDAVLTDTGRMRLAKGDGSFKIAKFALGDDEIVYSQFNGQHASGSAYFDLSIMQSPVLEAFTNNTSTMNSKLITIARTNLLYLPVMKNNTLVSPLNAIGAYVVAVDGDTETSFANIQGVIMGETLQDQPTFIRVDQGLDTSEISYAFTLDSDLVETQYIVELDNRFAKIVDVGGAGAARMSYIDDDSVASYYFSLGTDTSFVNDNNVRNTNSLQTIAGPRGTILQFNLQASLDLNTSTYLFEQLGSTIAGTSMGGTSANVYYIDSYIKVYGATTGYQLEIPVRFIKNI